MNLHRQRLIDVLQYCDVRFEGELMFSKFDVDEERVAPNASVDND